MCLYEVNIFNKNSLINKFKLNIQIGNLMRFSIIAPSYKEKEINKVLRLLLKQPLPKNWKLDKIFVVACGYEDFVFLKNKKIHVIREEQRMGKAYALNLALRKIKSDSKIDVVVIHNADVFPKRNMLKYLLSIFEDSSVGMSCVRPVSLDTTENFMGFLNNIVWDLHHLVSLESTKVGEAFAFRNVIKKIPKRLAADEAYIESEIRKRGYKITYVSNALVLNRGPQNILDFINQRKRIFTGHSHVKNKYGYEVSTMNIIRIIKAIIKYFKINSIKSPKQLVWLFCAIILEVSARSLGTIDFYIFKKVPYVWKMVKTSGR